MKGSSPRCCTAYRFGCVCVRVSRASLDIVSLSSISRLKAIYSEALFISNETRLSVVTVI